MQQKALRSFLRRAFLLLYAEPGYFAAGAGAVAVGAVVAVPVGVVVGAEAGAAGFGASCF